MAKPRPSSSSVQAICGNCGTDEKKLCKCLPNERRWESLASILSRCRSVNEVSQHGWFFMYLEYRRWFSPIANSVSSDTGILANFPAFEGWYPVWFLPIPPVEIIPEISSEKVLTVTLYFTDGTFSPAYVTHQGSLIVKDSKSSSPQFGVALDGTREVRSVGIARSFSWKEIVNETRGNVFGEYFKKRNGGRRISHIVGMKQEEAAFICREFPMSASISAHSVGGEVGDTGKSSRNVGDVVAIPGDAVRVFAPSLVEEYRGRNERKFTKEEASTCRMYIEALLKKAISSDLTARENMNGCLAIDNDTARIEDKEAAKELVNSFMFLQESVGQLYGSKIEEEVLEEG